MALEYGYFDSEITGYDEEGMPIFDRAKTSDFMADFFSKLITSGVLANPADCFQVVAHEGMTVQIRPGFGFIKGRFAYDKDPAFLTLEDAPSQGTYKRIDMIILRNNYAERKSEILIKPGIAAATPKEPELIQAEAGDYYELCLALVQVRSNQTAISQADITDTRFDSAYCGPVMQLIDKIDTSVFFAQLNQFYKDYVEQFDTDYADFTTKMTTAYQFFYTKLDELFNGYVDKYDTDYADFTSKMLEAYNQYLAELSDYFTALQNKGYGDMTEIVQRMAEFEVSREADFNAWFESVKDKMSDDVGAKVTLALAEQEARLSDLEEMLIRGEICAPLTTEDGNELTTENDDSIEAYWYYATK